MHVEYLPYEEDYGPQLWSLLDDFQDYFVALDPLGRLTRPEGYGREYLRRMIEEISEKSGTLLLALIAKRVIAFGSAIVERRLEDDWFGSTPAVMGRVTELFVDATYRNQGIGTALMQELESELRAKGCRYVWVEVFAVNPDAHRFYQRLGYGNRDIQMIKELYAKDA